MIKYYFSLLFVVALAIPEISAQSVRNRPEVYESVVDYGDTKSKEYRALRSEGTGGNISEDPWWVFSDRNDNAVYDKPSGAIVERIQLGQAFVVTDIDEDWIQIYEGAIEGNKKKKKMAPDAKEIGWVPMDNMLLWNTPLRNKASKIAIKAVIMNNVEGLEETAKNPDATKVFDSPEGINDVGDKTLYDFDFIYKKEGNRILIGQDDKITDFESTSKILGWVNKGKVVEWPTRIVVEPSFSANAFHERLENEDLRLAAFKSAGAADQHGQSSKIPKDEVLVIWDPVLVDAEDRQETDYDKYRFKGSKMRLPMLRDRGTYYETGVIGEITAELAQTSDQPKYDAADFKEKIKSTQQRVQQLKKFNVLFAIESNEYTAAHKDVILKIMAGTRSQFKAEQVRMGAILYNDYWKSSDGKGYTIIPVSSEVNSVIEKVANHPFESPDGEDRWTNMQEALNEGIKRSNINAEHTNILVVIGENGNYTRNKSGVISRLARAKKENHEILNDNKLHLVTARYNMHMIYVQPSRVDELDNQSISAFARDAWSNINEVAKQVQNEDATAREYRAKFKGEANPKNPMISDPDDEQVLILQYSNLVGQLLRPEIGQEFSSEKINRDIIKLFKEIDEDIDELVKQVSRSLESGSAFKGEVRKTGVDFNAAIIRVIKQSMRESKGKDPTPEEVQEMIRILYSRKTQLYTKAYIPKNIRSAHYPLLTYALFFNKSEYNQYRKYLDDIIDLRNEGDTEQRTKLTELLPKMLDKFVGGGNIDLGDDDLDKLRTAISGINKEGLNLEEKVNFKFSDIDNEKKVTPTQLRKFFDSIAEKTRIYRDYEDTISDTCTSCLEGSSKKYRYYWIPIDLLL